MEKPRKAVAYFFLFLMGTEMLMPMRAWALTSGPAQPEAQQFAQAGTSDMVDLFSGGFKYNLPLMDIDGYPINLSYESGRNMDEEASWVGLGWNLNVGAINRQLRGLPDDNYGDPVTVEHYTKPHTQIGGRGTLKGEIKGLNVLGLTGSLSVGLFNDSYTGMGAEVGANAGVDIDIANAGLLTMNMGVGVNSNTQSGVSVNPTATLTLAEQHNYGVSTSMGVSASLGYNSRQGLKDLTLSASYGVTGKSIWGDQGAASIEMGGTTFSFNTPPFTPSIGIAHRNSSETFSFDVGGVAWIVFGGGGMTGYKSRQEVLNFQTVHPSYGFMYAEKARENDNAVMDFMREKDNPVITALPNLAVPVATPDLFSFSSQTGSGQFRLYRSSTGVLADARVQDEGTDATAGYDVGWGGYVHGGVSLYNRNDKTTTGRWKNDNTYNAKADFQAAADRYDEPAYFKISGEQNAEDANFLAAIHGENLVKTSVAGKIANAGLMDPNGVQAISAPMRKNGRQVRNTNISYLNTDEAAVMGLDKNLSDFPYNEYNNGNWQPVGCNGTGYAGTPTVISRRTMKSKHISEITVQSSDGKRMVYGLPVQNLRQDEYSFAANLNLTRTPDDVKKNQIQYTFNATTGQIDHINGRDHYYHHELQSAYATSYMLTAILSPDYVDVTGDGITDDDMGTAIKFNYSKAAAPFKWRTPFEQNRAQYVRDLNADPDDDKGSIVYGEKDLWYLQSIETKTKILYFVTENRDDALGVLDMNGGKDVNMHQRRLRQVSLYSKGDLTKPIKTAVLNYDYSLCPGVPNNVTGGGKLTLTSVYFQYGNSTKGKQHPYIFTYNNTVSGATPSYLEQCTDRWGTFKPQTANSLAGVTLSNDRYPYTAQDKASADSYAGLWNLQQVTLPSGGKLMVDYESGDYAYVQDQRAMQMTNIKALVDASEQTTTAFTQANGFQIKVDADMPTNLAAAQQTKWFADHYLNGESVMYAKLLVKFDNGIGGTIVDSDPDKGYDFVPCYGKVAKVHIVDSRTANVLFENTNDGAIANPFIMAAWQKMRSEYQRFAYPGYVNRFQNDMPLVQGLSAIVNAIGNLSELTENFNQKALRKKYCNDVKLSGSFARVVKGSGIKLGGPARVKRIRITDDWAEIQGSGAGDATYGQSYEYTTTVAGQTVSSGVASYEPGVGNDENPLHLPVPYTEKIKGALSNTLYLERPFGEALYPAPSVGYSKVSVYDLDENGVKDAGKRTGYGVHEFYTARDFPVEVQQTENPLVRDYKPQSWFNFFGASIRHELSMSQGYLIRLNDMHGKPKADHIFNQSGAEVSGDEYYYNTEEMDAGKMRLKNVVDVINEAGQITPNTVVGRTVEMYTDMRESESDNKGRSIQIGADIVPGFWGIPFPIPHWPRKDEDQYLLFRSATNMKVIQYAGMIDHVVKRVNGSTSTSKTLLYDANTGDPIVTQTNNEFDDPVYSVSMPAYWVYARMGNAYKNQGMNFNMNISNGADIFNLKNFLVPGDEVVNVNTGKHYWAIFTTYPNGVPSNMHVVDVDGNLVNSLNAPVKLLHSGYRNQTGASTMTITCLKSPITTVNGVKTFTLQQDAELASQQVIDAKATLYDETWAQEGKCTTCPAGYHLSMDGKYCDATPQSGTDPHFVLHTGSQNVAYGSFGGLIYSSTNNTTPKYTVLNSTWGGYCGGASFQSVQSKMVVPATAGGNDSSATGPSQQAAKTGSAAATNTQAVANTIDQRSASFCGRLNACGVWWGTDSSTVNTYGISSCFTAPYSGDYQIGYAVDNNMWIYVDGTLWNSLTNTADANLKYWTIRHINLSAGKHTLRIEGKNDLLNGNPSSASLGLDVYAYATDEILQTVSDPGLKNYIIWSTENLANQPIQTYIKSGSSTTYRYNCLAGSQMDVCDSVLRCRIPVTNIFNPYVLGVLGNWRPLEDKVFEVNRTDAHVFDATYNGSLIRKSGYYQSFTPFWVGNQVATTNASRWVSSRFVTMYDRYGQELENHDALNRYSGAVFGFRGQLASAVGVNTQQREMFYDGFEDYKYRGLCGMPALCNTATFDIYQAASGKYISWIDATVAHTGNYSLKITDNLDLTAATYSNVQRSDNYFTLDASGQYVRNLAPWNLVNGFNPVSNKQYVFTAWVHDNNPGSKEVSLQLTINGANVQLARKATVEGWKLVEGTFYAGSDGSNMALRLSGAVNIDDIRIFPFDAEVKTYAYDDATLRLMATLDENNFATFYEYDAEGSLVRLKKETDRGIMTIKETRSAIHVNPTY